MMKAFRVVMESCTCQSFALLAKYRDMFSYLGSHPAVSCLSSSLLRSAIDLLFSTLLPDSFVSIDRVLAEHLDLFPLRRYASTFFLETWSIRPSFSESIDYLRVFFIFYIKQSTIFSIYLSSFRNCMIPKTQTRAVVTSTISPDSTA